MDESELAVFLPVFFGSLLVFFAGLFLVISRVRRVEHPVTSQPPQQPGGGAAGRWNGEILGSGFLGAVGGTTGSTFGVFEVRDGTMFFTPEGAAAPDWTVPCVSLVVSKRGVMSFNGADLSISYPDARGEWRMAQCNVSRERINRVMGNDFKDLRERGYAAEFLHCLAANGARAGR